MTQAIRDYMLFGRDDRPASTPAPERAIRYESGDAPASRSTGYSMSVGDSFNGRLSQPGDADWVRVQLQPGVYVISLDARGSSGVSDPYLRVMNAAGLTIASDDDGGSVGLNSRLTLSVTTAGTYYLEAGSFASQSAGYYSLGISRSTQRSFTSTEIAQQLTDGYWNYTGQSRRAFDARPGDVLNVDLSGLTTEGRALANMALAAWEAATGLRFNRSPGSGAPIHITFDDSDRGAYSSSTTSGGRIVSSFVNVGLDWLSSSGTQFNGYSYQTYIHEIGHALGLGHAGNYNGNATYGVDNHYLNDSWQASVMSYFSQDENPMVNASRAYIMTPMVADILAMRSLYGTSGVRTGDNTYGETTNAGASYTTVANLLRNVTTRDDIAFTIFDQGGTDRLDLSTDTHNQRIILLPGANSNAYGLVGNISIAPGTVIEHVTAGRGNDVVVANSANNFLSGGLGNDTLRGLEGNDTLQGGGGRDQLEGGSGNDTYYTDGLDRLVEAAGAGTDTVRSYVSLTLGSNLENLELVGSSARNALGNSLSNRLVGNANANVLAGYGGNDTLYGGGGADDFYFHSGRDVVLDFRDNVDTLRIDDALWGGGARSVAQVLQSAHVIGSNTVFTFANGNSLTLNNFTNIAALQNDLVIF